MNMNFESSDIWLSAFLSTCGITPSLQMKHGKVVFVFPASPDLDRLIVNYQNNCNVKVIDFSSAAKTLRGQMLSLKKTGAV